METPLGSGAAPNFFFFFVFLCITPRQTVLLAGDSPVPTACVGGWMGACACFYDWERVGEKRRQRSKQGGRDWENEQKGGGGWTTGRGMNDGDNEWETQTDIRAPVADYSARTSSSRDDWSTYVWVSRVSVWVEGCRNSAAYFASGLIPAAQISGAPRCIYFKPIRAAWCQIWLHPRYYHTREFIMTLMIFRAL